MTALIIIMGFLSAGVVVILLLPFMRDKNADKSSSADQGLTTRSAYDLTVYKDQIKEIERDHERGLFDEVQAEAARLEIQRRMLALAESEPDAVYASPTGRKFVIALIAGMVPVGAFVMYGFLGSPATPDFPFAERPQQNQQAVVGETTVKLLERLKARLESQPNNIQGWLLLARSSMSVEKYEQAASAYRKAIALGASNPDIAVDYAEALSVSGGAVVTDEARKIFADTVIRDPLNTKARYYLGLAQAQQGNIKEALQAWVDLRALSPPNAPWSQVVNRQIARAVQDLGLKSPNLKPSAAIQALMENSKSPVRAVSPEMQAPQAPVRGPTAGDVEAAGQMSAKDRAAFIRSMVQRLADRLKENPNDRNGWLRLARAYDVLGEKKKAQEARAKAESLK